MPDLQENMIVSAVAGTSLQRLAAGFGCACLHPQGTEVPSAETYVLLFDGLL
jgi:hypothetical protein